MLPKQHAFLAATEKEVLYSGAFGAGKSRAVCMKTVMHAQHKNNFVGLCRKTFTSLRHSTLRTLLHAEGGCEPILKEGTYEHNKSEHIITLNGGGQIVYFGLDNPQVVGSFNLGAIGVDESIELDSDEYAMLLGRIRNSNDPCNQIFGATNPGPHGHFLYDRFFRQRHVDRLAIETRSADNIFLPADYQQMLSEFTGQLKARYVDGKWGAFEGLVYDTFDRATHVKRRDPSEFADWIIGVDEGYTNPAVALLIGVDSDGRAHVAAEFYRRRVTPEAHVDNIVTMSGEHGGCDVSVDPSAAGLIASLRNRGCGCPPADNDRRSGIRAVHDRLAVQGDGLPRLTFDPDCANTLQEIESYQYRPDSDEPVKEFDHAMDALRYAVMHLQKRSPLSIMVF